MLTVRKIYYRGRKYWLLQADTDNSISLRVKSIAETRWSPCKNGWLLPVTKKAWSDFQVCFKSSEYQVERAYFSPKLSGHKVRIEFEKMPTDKSRMIVRMRKFTKRHLEVIRRVEGAKYHVDVRCWSVPVGLVDALRLAFEELD